MISDLILLKPFVFVASMNHPPCHQLILCTEDSLLSINILRASLLPWLLLHFGFVVFFSVTASRLKMRIAISSFFCPIIVDCLLLRRCLCNRRRVPLKRCILQRFSDFEVSIHFIITHFSSATNSVSSFEGD